MRRPRNRLPGLLLLLGGCMLFGMSGCGREAELAGNSIYSETEADKDPGKTNESSREGTAEELVLDDASVCFSWPGKTPEEAGLPESDTDREEVIPFSGNLFGYAAAYGRISLQRNQAAEPARTEIRHIWFTCDDLPLEEAAALFTRQLGRPFETGEEAYVEVNGGAVRWLRFFTGDNTVQISQASERHYLEVNVTAGPFSEEWIATAERLNEETAYTFYFEDGGLEELSVRYDEAAGCAAWGLSFQYEGALYHVDLLPSCEELPEICLVCEPLFWEVVFPEGDEAAFAFREDGSGLVLWRDFYGSDLWVLYMEGEADEEGLLAMRDRLRGLWRIDETG